MLTTVSQGDVSATQKNNSYVLNSTGALIANYTAPEPVTQVPSSPPNNVTKPNKSLVYNIFIDFIIYQCTLITDSNIVEG